MSFAPVFSDLQVDPNTLQTLSPELTFPGQVFLQLDPFEQNRFIDRLGGLSTQDASFLFNSIADTDLPTGTSTFRQFINSPSGEDFPFLLASSQLPFSPTQQVSFVQGQLGIPVADLNQSWRSSWIQ